MTTTTHLEMPSPAQLRPKRCNDARFTVRECTIKQRRFNRFLYLTVGEDWQWTDRRGWLGNYRRFGPRSVDAVGRGRRPIRETR